MHRLVLLLGLTFSGLTLGGFFAPSASAQRLFISEYIEGSSNNKAIELYNPTASAIDLAAGGYQLLYYFNGSSAAGLTISLTGTVAPGDVYVVAQSSADAAILAQADQTNGAGWFNGDDAVVLRSATDVLDVVGQIGFDPGTEWGTGLTSTADNTLRRKASACEGDADGYDAFDPAAEFDGYATNTFDGLGSHTGCRRSLFFSEYVEGSSLNKAVEIYNPTGAAVNLADYTLEIYFNGSATAGATIALSGTLAAGDVYVVADDGADAAILAVADLTPTNNFFNGDDAVVLRKGADLVDVIGQIGFDPGTEWGTGLTSTADNTLRRKASVCEGDADGSDAFDPAAEFDGFANNTFDGLGSHTATCAGTSTPGDAAPQFTATLTSQTIPAGQPFSFDYDAFDPDGTPVTFTLAAGPAGAVIGAATGVFSWTPTNAQAGQGYLVRVAATSNGQTTTTEATLTVTNTGTPPVFTASFSGSVVPVGQVVTFDYDANDLDGGVVTYSLVGAPSGAAIDAATGVMTFTPSAPGAYALTVRATDDEATSTTTTAYVGARGTLFAGQTGAALRASLRAAYTPTRTLGYDTARDTMYFKIDRGLMQSAAEPEGAADQVCGVYTGFCVTLPANVDPSSYLASNGINAEHTWPQSKGASVEPQRSDMHHLFPSKDNVNSSRGNKPYGESPDATTQTWYRGATSQTTIPASDIDAWSESAPGVFEPRERHKGNAARAALYFYAIYESAADAAFLLEQVEDLAAWNALDTTDVAEVKRTYLVGLRQGNVNPFLFDATLARRAYADVLAPQLDCTDPATAPTYAGGYVLNAAGTRAFVRLAVPAGAAEVRFYQTRNLLVGDPETSAESGVVLAGVTRAGDVFTFAAGSMAAMASELYFPIRTATSETGVAFYLQVTDACGRVVDVDPSFTLTGVEGDDALAFSLAQAVPNPVRASATIAYGVEQPGAVTLAVYDVLGREVAMLAQGSVEAGRHTATVDASSLAPGVYVYRLTSGSRTLTRTFTVAR